MKNLVALLCMVLAFVGSVYSVECYSCDSENSPTCDEKVITCENRCMTQSTEYFNDENSPTEIRKGCTNDDSETNCGKKIEGNSTNGKSEITMSCCDSNLCNTDDLAFRSTPSFSTATSDPLQMIGAKKRTPKYYGYGMFGLGGKKLF
ncbi:uncharacterized protein ACNLHF_001577 [Anomaloglossus baeobatrachus]